MANIQGATNALPGPYTDVITQSSGVAIPGGSRVVAMIGQGFVAETLVPGAQGGGLDGLDPTFTTNVGADGRHFATQNSPLIANYTTIFKNGIPLVGFETTPITTTLTFSSIYQYAFDPTTGHLLLQAAALQDQGGTNYVPLSTNVGVGSLAALQLLDQDAPPEIWTIRCISVVRNAMNQPIAGTAQFIAIGSVSGSLLDANGNPFIWVADGYAVSNGILSFSVQETFVGSQAVSPFVPGDGFTVIVSSGVLVRGDVLTTTEIPTNNINSPVLTLGMKDVVNYCGMPSLVNNLALGAQLLYANSASSMWALLAAPPLPRRTSYILDPSVNALSTDVNEFLFPFPIGVVPDINAEIHVFVTNPATKVERQVLPNQFPYYELNKQGQPTLNDFVFSNFQPPAGYANSYTVMQELESVENAFDGVLARLPAFQNKATLGSASVEFTASYAGQLLRILDSKNAANNGVFNITAVTEGQLSIQTILEGESTVDGYIVPQPTPTGFPDFIQDPADQTFQLIYIPTGLPVTGGSGTDGSLIGYVNTAQADFSSVAIDFGSIDTSVNLVANYRLQINGSTVGNDGLYDIVGYTSGDNTLRIAMAFVSESDLRWEVLDPTVVSSYLVLNYNVVPNGNQLRVTIVDQRDAPFYDAGWVNALAALETVEIDILVTLPNQTISVIFQNALSHCITMSDILNRKERVLFLGAINGLTPANLTGAQLAAVEDLGPLEGIPNNNITSTLAQNIQDIANYSVSNSYGETFRAVYFYPDQIIVQAGADLVEVDGFYIAAAAAGYANADVALQNPFTNKVFSGFTILNNNTYSNLILQQLAAAGVTTLQPVGGGGRVVWGITTTQSGIPEEQEISIVFIRDRVAKVLRAGFAGFVGQPQDPNTATALNTEAVILLNSLISQGLITAFQGLTVVQDTVDPRQWDITVQVQPTYPINWIYIQVTVTNLGA